MLNKMFINIVFEMSRMLSVNNWSSEIRSIISIFLNKNWNKFWSGLKEKYESFGERYGYFRIEMPNQQLPS